MNSRISHPAAWSFAAVSLFSLLMGCSQEEAVVEVPEAVRPVKTVLVGGPELSGERRFPGRVDSSSKAELAFRIPGTIKSIAVREGDFVKEGQVLAELDPTDYEIQLNDRQASYDRAEKDFQRAKELVKDGFISRTDFDKKEAEFKSAEAALQTTKQDMEYTKLRAPFPGAVAQRYVENAEEVQAKQAVLALQDEDRLEIKVDVPQGIVSRIERGKRGEDGDGAPVWATFDAAPDRRIDLTFKEASTRADPATQTFGVSFLMERPEGVNVLPGMTANVVADLSSLAGGGESQYLPVSAVTADAELAPFVWVVDEAAGTVAKAPVKVGRMSGWNIAVEGGIEPGSRVVVAGVGYLAEGMKVRLMEQHEQAEPRPDEAPVPIVPEAETEAETEGAPGTELDTAPDTGAAPAAES